MALKMLHTALRVGELDRSLRFYENLGFDLMGRVPLPDGVVLMMLNLPGDGDVTTLELAYDPRLGPYVLGNGLSHIVVQVDDLDAQIALLASKGIAAGEPEFPAGSAGPKTSFLSDPDGHRIELVQWPPGHADGITRADFV